MKTEEMPRHQENWPKCDFCNTDAKAEHNEILYCWTHYVDYVEE
jgi:hypothetical protein